MPPWQPRRHAQGRRRDPTVVFAELRAIDASNIEYLPDALLFYALRQCGLNPSVSNVELLKQRIDTDGSGRIDRVEFVRFCNELDMTRPRADELRAAFAAFDTDGSGFLERDEFAALLRDGGEPLSDVEVEMALQLADGDGDGRINYEEFVAMLCDDEEEFTEVMEASAEGSPDTRLNALKPSDAAGSPESQHLDGEEDMTQFDVHVRIAEASAGAALALQRRRQAGLTAKRTHELRQQALEEEKRKQDEEEARIEKERKKKEQAACCSVA